MINEPGVRKDRKSLVCIGRKFFFRIVSENWFVIDLSQNGLREQCENITNKI